MNVTSVRPRVLMLVAGLGLLLPASDSRADVPQLDVNARNFRKRVQVLGTLPYGTTTPNIVLRGLPRFRAFAFRGNANDPVEIWVRSPDGDPVAWVVNERFGVIAVLDRSWPMPDRTSRIPSSSSLCRPRAPTTSSSAIMISPRRRSR